MQACQTTTMSFLIVALVAAAVLFIVHTFFHHVSLGWLAASKTSGRPPVVWSWVPFLRSALSFGADPNKFIVDCRRQYGPVFKVELGGRVLVFVTDPHSYSAITRARDGLNFTEIGAAVGRSVLAQSEEMTSDMDLDRVVHQQFASFLSGSDLDTITRDFQTNLQKWAQWFADTRGGRIAPAAAVSGRSSDSNAAFAFPLLHLCTVAIFAASTRALFGEILIDSPAASEMAVKECQSKAKSRGEVLPVTATAAATTASAAAGPVPTPQYTGEKFSDSFYYPSTLLQQFHDFDEAFVLLYGGIPTAFVKKGVEARAKLIHTLQTQRPGACEFFQQREKAIAGNMFGTMSNPRLDYGAAQLGMLWAMQGNTVPGSFWTLFFLLQHPTEMQRVRQSIQEGVKAAMNKRRENDEDLTAPLTREELKSFTLLDCAISESLRLSTGSMMMRRCSSDLELDLPCGKLTLNKGENVAIYPFTTHHDPAVFADPEEYRLSRWEDKPVEGSTITAPNGQKIASAFLPFGSGISMCPGRHFARNEIKLALITLLQLFEFAPQGELKHPGYLLSRAGLGIYPPAKDVTVMLKPIAQTTSA